LERAVNQAGIEEVVADRGYHSDEVMRKLAEWKLRSYFDEPERDARKWKGKVAERVAVYANRRRISGARGKRLQAGRGERVERKFAHQFNTGGMDRLYVRGLHNVYKKLLIQAAACNLAMLMRTLYGAGKPRAAHDRWGPARLCDSTAVFGVDRDLPIRVCVARGSRVDITSTRCSHREILRPSKSRF
jgi:hypothetical protein